MIRSTHRRAMTMVSLCFCALFLFACTQATGRPDARIDATGGNVERGEQVARDNGCMACHSVSGMPSVENGFGPDLDGWSDNVVIAGQVENLPENLVQFLVDPQSVAPGSGMPSVGLTEDEARDVASWLYTLTD